MSTLSSVTHGSGGGCHSSIFRCVMPFAMVKIILPPVIAFHLKLHCYLSQVNFIWSSFSLCDDSSSGSYGGRSFLEVSSSLEFSDRCRHVILDIRRPRFCGLTAVSPSMEMERKAPSQYLDYLQ